MNPLPLAEFLERTSLENQLYWTVTSTYTANNILEIQWYNYKTKRPWRARIKNEQSWGHYSAETLIEKLREEHWDLDQFNRELATTLLTQAVYAQMVISGAERLLGQKAVAHAVKQTESFLDEITVLTEKHLGAGEAAKENAVAATEDMPPLPELGSQNGLRIVKSEEI